MPDPCPILALLAGGYAAALLGAGPAHVARALRARCSPPLTSHEAATYALLPPTTLLLFLLVVSLPFESSLLPHGVHAQWHLWAAVLHRHDGFHGFLHALNVFFSVAVAVTVVRAAYFIGQIAGSQRTLTQAAVKSRVVHGLRVHVLPLDGFACFTVGLFRPSVYATETMLSALADREARAMLAHERAHVRRGDPLFTTFLAVFACVLPIPGYRALVRDWLAAAERACDREAAEEVGSACDVASALVTVAGLLTTTRQVAPPAASCFSRTGADEGVEGRVAALLAPRKETASYAARALAPALWGVTALLACLLAPCLRHCAELLFLH